LRLDQEKQTAVLLKTAINEADSGGNINANELMRQQFFGRPLLEGEVADAEQNSAVQVNYANGQKSFTQRYFALSNYDSLLTHVGMDLGASTHDGIMASVIRLGSSILRPMSSISALIGSLTTPTVYAAADSIEHDYGNVQFGWPASEKAVLTGRNSDSYKMLENQAILDQSGNEDAIATKYAICFGYKYNAGGTSMDPTDQNSDLQVDPLGSIGNLLANREIVRDNNTGDVINGGGTCDPNNLSYNNTSDPLAADAQSPEPDGVSSPQANDMVFRWRLAMEYLTTVDQLTNAQNVTAD
jgi:hypothetical protein